MTREHKLALIIGFSLILFVGILISDHLSKAGSGVYQPALDAERRLAETIGPLDVGLAPRPLPERPGAGMERHRARSERAAEAGAPAGFEPEGEPERLAAGGSTRDGSAGIEEGASRLLVPVDDQEGAAGAGGETLIASGWRLLDQVMTGIGQGPLAPRPALEIEQSRGAPAPGATLPEGPYVTHVVQRGESLYQIAAEYYGSGAQWPRIRDFNAGRIGEDGLVRVGVTIRVPGVAPEGAAADRAPARSPARSSASATREYTVRRNDTLGEIAQQLLGSARRRAEIVELNRDKISNEDEIRVGMVLAIPAG